MLKVSLIRSAFSHHQKGEYSMIDLSTLSKSYPYLSLARQLGLPYRDVLLVADYYDCMSNDITPVQRDARHKVTQKHAHLICHVACAVANGEIGHGG